MKIRIKITDYFKSEAKPLLKKYHSLNDDLINLEKQLLENPELGTPLGNNSFKIRLKITSKGRGKSGGARVITYLETELIANVNITETGTIVNLLSIYDKSDTATITDKELRRLIENIKRT